MQFGIMMRGQFPQGDKVADRFEELLAQARLAETLGYNSITKGAHYSTHPLQDLQQIPFLCRVAAEAPSLRLNTGVLLLPLHKPLDVAEQLGTLDIMTNGKAIEEAWHSPTRWHRPARKRSDAGRVPGGRFSQTGVPGTRG